MALEAGSQEVRGRGDAVLTVVTDSSTKPGGALAGSCPEPCSGRGSAASLRVPINIAEGVVERIGRLRIRPSPRRCAELRQDKVRPDVEAPPPGNFIAAVPAAVTDRTSLSWPGG